MVTSVMRFLNSQVLRVIPLRTTSPLTYSGGVVPDTRWLNEEEQRTWRSYLTSCRLLFDRIERQLQQDAGLPHAYYEILVRLSEAPGRSMRMSQLATSAMSSRSRLSHAVARLEESGWV